MLREKGFINKKVLVVGISRNFTRCVKRMMGLGNKGKSSIVKGSSERRCHDSPT
jgi:hypothetical protein